MGRIRNPVTLNRLKKKGDRYFVYLKHPVRKRTVCFAMGKAGEVTQSVEALNRIYMDEGLWLNPPQDTTPSRIYSQWIGPDGILKLHGTGLVEIGQNNLEVSPEKVAVQQSIIDMLKRQLETFKNRCEQQGRELEALRGEQYQPIKCRTLTDARDLVLESIGAKDPDHVKHVRLDLARFIAQFGSDTRVDAFTGSETRINCWLHSLKKRDGTPLGPSARQYIRIYVLKLLKMGGARIDASKIDRISKKELKSKRQKIRWLTNEQALALLQKLPQPYADAFRIQVRIGLRPFELLTLHRDNFTDDFSELRLEPLSEALTLKTGPRKNPIPIPPDLRPILEARALECPILFAEPRGRVAKRSRPKKITKRNRRCGPAPGDLPWRDPAAFSRRFKNELNVAAESANVKMPMDARVGRRTCASLLLQNGVPVATIAELLGNSPEQVLAAYGDPSIKTMSLAATELKKV
jgi:integrase